MFQFIKFFLYNIHSKQNKTDTDYLIDEKDSSSYSAERFFLIFLETNI